MLDAFRLADDPGLDATRLAAGGTINTTEPSRRETGWLALIGFIFTLIVIIALLVAIS